MNLLLEIFGEEIPARMQARASDDLRRIVTDGLVEAGLTYAAAAACYPDAFTHEIYLVPDLNKHECRKDKGDN